MFKFSGRFANILLFLDNAHYTPAIQIAASG